MPPTHIGKYVVKSRLGQGAMGEVYLAEDPFIERPVAIKWMLKLAYERNGFTHRPLFKGDRDGWLGPVGFIFQPDRPAGAKSPATTRPRRPAAPSRAPRERRDARVGYALCRTTFNARCRAASANVS